MDILNNIHPTVCVSVCVKRTDRRDKSASINLGTFEVAESPEGFEEPKVPKRVENTCSWAYLYIMYLVNASTIILYGRNDEEESFTRI